VGEEWLLQTYRGGLDLNWEKFLNVKLETDQKLEQSLHDYINCYTSWNNPWWIQRFEIRLAVVNLTMNLWTWEHFERLIDWSFAVFVMPESVCSWMDVEE
jgi:hypothetical protein